MIKKLFPLVFIMVYWCIPAQLFPQSGTDSLIALANSQAHDSVRINAMLDICWALKASNPELALKYGEKALNMSRISSDKLKEATALKNIATIHLFQSNYPKAESYFAAAISINNSINNPKGLSGCYNNLGLVKELKGEFDLAMEYYFKSLAINEKIDNKSGVASCQTNIGNIFQKQGNYRKSIEYYIQALKTKEEINDKTGIADAYNNIGALYEKQKAFEQANKNYQKALILYIETDEKRKSGMVFHNLGFIENLQKRYESAMDYFEKALELRREVGDKQGVATSLMNIGEVYFNTGKPLQALEYYQKGEEIFTDIGNKYGILQAKLAQAKINNNTGHYIKAISIIEPMCSSGSLLPEDLKEAYLIISQAFANHGNMNKAYHYLLQYNQLKDSLTRDENSKNLIQLQLDYEFQKKQKEAEIEQEKQRINNLGELNKRKMIIIVLSVFLFTFILIGFLAYRGYLIKKKDNAILEKQKIEIEEYTQKLLLFQEELVSQKESLEVQKKLISDQRDELEEKNQRINDSIQYAKRIQTSLLPNENIFKQNFTDYFILFKPKDIVSGDFYWCRETEEHIFIAAADCTGHGVPGAFMSLLGISFLNEVIESGKSDTGEILDTTRNKIIKTMHGHSSEKEPRDGMDIGLCSIHKVNRTLQFSGAYISLLILKNGIENNTSLIEIRGDKMPIGPHLKGFTSFSSEEHKIEKGDKFFIYTDGYIDQFGGTFDQKFLPQKFKDILLKTNNDSMPVQKNALIESLDSWMEGREQIDDILVIGFKL
jgi:tetratricopeptide (TPR) repeat protein